MSGGHFGYLSGRIYNVAEEIENIIENNNNEEKDEWGSKKGYFFRDEVIEEFKKGAKYLKLASIYERRIDWLVSSDDGEDDFLKRLKLELKKLEDWDMQDE